jgi:hypothetical protein
MADPLSDQDPDGSYTTLTDLTYSASGRCHGATRSAGLWPVGGLACVGGLRRVAGSSLQPCHALAQALEHRHPLSARFYLAVLSAGAALANINALAAPTPAPARAAMPAKAATCSHGLLLRPLSRGYPAAEPDSQLVPRGRSGAARPIVRAHSCVHSSIPSRQRSRPEPGSVSEWSPA